MFWNNATFFSGVLLKKIIWQYQLVQHLLSVGLYFPHGAGTLKHDDDEDDDDDDVIVVDDVVVDDDVIQAIVFYIPRCIWLSMEGGLMNFLVKGTQG